jgi:F420-0:gamma-glutamyl ligase-like protein
MGSGETVFAALQNAFERVSELGPVVMVVTLSNACPLPKNRDRNQENSRAEIASDLGDNNG